MFRSFLAFVPVFVIASIAGCATPNDLDLSLQHATVDGKYIVTLQPPATPPAINQIHSWQVLVSTPAGQPVSQARIAVDGGMPQHGHGLPTRPQIRATAGDSHYVLEGMKFSMTGWWEIKLAIQTPEGADKVKYFEGTPIPTSVVLVGVLAFAAWKGAIGGALWGGAWTLGPWVLHPITLLFGLSGTLMISKTLRIPKF